MDLADNKTEEKRILYVVLGKYARPLLGRRLDDLLSSLTRDFRVTVVDSMTSVQSLRESGRSDRPLPDQVLVIGGDGTVNLVLNTPVATLPIAIFPVGTANDLATFLQLSRSTSDILSILQTRRSRQLDTLQVNRKVFCTTGGLGLPGQAVERVSHFRNGGPVQVRTIHRLGALAYWMAAARSIAFPAKGDRLTEWKITHQAPGSDAVKIIESESSGLLIANQPLLAGKLRISPTSRPDDGVFEIIILRKHSRTALLRLLARLASGGLPEHDEIFTIEAVNATIESRKTEQFFGDGEILARGRKFKVEIIPSSLRVLIA